MNPQPTCGSKLGLDATIPRCGTSANPESACSRLIGVRGWPPLLEMDEAATAKAEKLLNSQPPT
jgi:3-polyprenyl-4-hydroxybenzoate decarboxylase